MNCHEGTRWQLATEARVYCRNVSRAKWRCQHIAKFPVGFLLPLFDYWSLGHLDRKSRAFFITVSQHSQFSFQTPSPSVLCVLSWKWWQFWTTTPKQWFMQDQNVACRWTCVWPSWNHASSRCDGKCHVDAHEIHTCLYNMTITWHVKRSEQSYVLETVIHFIRILFFTRVQTNKHLSTFCFTRP